MTVASSICAILYHMIQNANAYARLVDKVRGYEEKSKKHYGVACADVQYMCL